FAPDELRTWLDAVFQGQRVEPDPLPLITRCTEGNPLLATQLLRTLRDDELLVYGERGWELTPATASQMPAIVTRLLEHRLARLAPRARRVLSTAAVIGRTFDLNVLVAATGGAPEAVIDAVDDAISYGLLEPEDAADPESGRYTFAHALLVDAALGDSTPRQR